MADNMFQTGAVMDYVSKAQTIQADTKTIEDAAVKNNSNQKIINMPRKTRTIVREYEKIGRNEQCPCGSGKKYKNCCLNSGKFEHQHELTALEMAKVKAKQIKLSEISKDAKTAKVETVETETVAEATPIKKRTRTKKTVKKDAE